jgi:hypothetical protein
MSSLPLPRTPAAKKSPLSIDGATASGDGRAWNHGYADQFPTSEPISRR